MNLRRRAALRFYLRRPAQLALALAGIALGVAVVAAVDLASDTALRAFKLSQALIASRATHIVEASLGSLPETIYARLKVSGGVDLAAPVLEGQLTLAQDPAATLRLLGIDPLAELAFDDGLRLAPEAGDPNADITSLLTRSDGVILPTALANQLQLHPGDHLPVRVAGALRSLTIVGVMPFAAAGGDAGPVITDIATAQELTNAFGELSRIELALAPEAVERIQAQLPAAVTLTAVADSDDVTRDMLRAFRINLAALSLLALVVGMLLIYATMSFAVVQRREGLGTLRALGVTRWEVARDVLAESLLLGIASSAVGLLLGWLLAQGLTALVLTTINDLYFRARVTPEGVALLPFVKAGVLGVGATLLAGVRPAMEAAREAPRAAMTRAAFERTARAQLRWAPWAAAGLLGTGALLIALPGEGLLAAFFGLFCVLAGYGVLTPAATGWLLGAVGRWGRPLLGLAPRLAVRGAAASLGRTGVAVTALAVAVAHVVGIGVMIDSFRASVADWLDQSLVADFYLLTQDDGPGGFTPAEISRLEALPGVRALSRSRTLTLKTRRGEVAIRAATPGPSGYGETLVQCDPDTAFAALERGAGILLAEGFARRQDLGPGDMLELPGPEGPARFQVVGMLRDYRTADSAALLPYTVVNNIWGEQAPLGLGVYVTGEGPRAALEAFAARRGATSVAANSEIRRVTLSVFDRTFTVTSVLRLLGGVVAFFGILSALLALQLERVREVATLRALGFTRRQAGGNALAQTTLLGLVAGVLALPLGLALAALLVYVINQRSFGWSMGFSVEPAQLALGVALAVGAAFLAGVYPGRQLALAPVAKGLRTE
jgi:putative ABC transport system permease protein